MDMDVSHFDPRHCPDTEAKLELIESGEDSAVSFVKSLKWKHDGDNYERISTTSLWQRYQNWLIEMGIDLRFKGSPKKFSVRIEEWVEKKKSNTMYYQPLPKLIDFSKESTQVLEFQTTPKEEENPFLKELENPEGDEDDLEELREKDGLDLPKK
jgi:hypothetical protein